MQKPEGEYPLKFSSNNLSVYKHVVLIGKIVSVHGLKGTVKVHSFSESLSLYDSLDKLLVEVPGSHGLVTMGVVWARPYKRRVYLHLRGRHSRADATLLVGSNIYVKKTALPPLEDDSYFWSDLIGISVQSALGEALGFISSIIRTGSNDVYVIKSNKIGARGEILIPAIKSVVLDVNLATRLMVVDLPEGI